MFIMLSMYHCLSIKVAGHLVAPLYVVRVVYLILAVPLDFGCNSVDAFLISPFNRVEVGRFRGHDTIRDMQG